MHPNDDRLNDLEASLIQIKDALIRDVSTLKIELAAVQQAHDHTRRDKNAIVILCCFFALLGLIGAKFEDGHFKWSLESSTVVTLIEGLGIAGVISGGWAITKQGAKH